MRDQKGVAMNRKERRRLAGKKLYSQSGEAQVRRTKPGWSV
jgi:hypothetical protein